MNNTNAKQLFIISIFLFVIAIGISSTALVIAMKSTTRNNSSQEATTESEDIQYVLYLGTNDKDSNKPIFDEEESQEKLKEILLDHFGGFTIQEAHGGWADGDTVYQEYTLVIHLSDTNIDEVYSACDDMISTFNQSSILIQSNQTTTEFYEGK